MILQHLSEGFVLGLATGPLCFVTCGLAYSPFLLQKDMGLWLSTIHVIKISIGRFFSYAMFGVLAAVVGMSIDQNTRVWFTAVSYILFSSMLMIFAFRTQKHQNGCQVARWSKFSENAILFGFLTGINFCPSFLVALTSAFNSSGIYSSLALFLAFFISTNLFILPLIFFGALSIPKNYIRLAIISLTLATVFFGCYYVLEFSRYFRDVGLLTLIIFAILSLSTITKNRRLFRTIGIIASLAIGTWFITKAVKTIWELTRPVDTSNVLSVLDFPKLYLVAKDTAQFALVKDSLDNHRKDRVFFTLKPDTLRDSCAILVEPAWLAQSEDTIDRLKRPNRFVVVLPEKEPAGSYDSVYADKILSFFDSYLFKLDPHGSMFNMSGNDHNHK